ncbi:MAG: oligosaccharide flippase family protein [Fimbriimonadales bacterium]|nr:oligosaccharide flippase family protein [Fimbriimonadales bacterium]
MRPEPSLRRRAVEGSVYLTVRRLLGIGLSAAGLLLMTRLVGPDNYGLFAAALGLNNYLLTLAQMGIRVYLVRREDAPALWRQAFSWLLIWSLSLTALAMLGLTVAQQFWIRTEGFMAVASAICLGLPLAATAAAPQAKLERELRYRRIAALELSAQASGYAVGIPLAQLGYGVWALVASYWATLLVSAGGAFLSAHFRTRWHWNRTLWREMARFSAAQGASLWFYMTKDLMPGFILLPLGGKEAVGYYALATRLLEMLSFAPVTIRRVADPVYARLQHEPAKLLRAMYLSSAAQMLALAATCLPFVIGAWYVLPIVFGAQWQMPLVLATMAILTAEQLLSTVFISQAQALGMVGRPQLVARFAALFAPHLALATTLAVWLAPSQWASVAYAAAYYWAHLPNNWQLHHAVRRHIGQPYYGMSLLWAFALSIAMFAPLAYYLPLLALSVFALPQSRAALRELYAELRLARKPPTGGVETPCDNHSSA